MKEVAGAQRDEESSREDQKQQAPSPQPRHSQHWPLWTLQIRETELSRVAEITSYEANGNAVLIQEKKKWDRKGRATVLKETMQYFGKSFVDEKKNDQHINYVLRMEHC